jgi:hypothetical protein
MDYIKQAYELDAAKKLQAKELYKRAVCELVHKDYVMQEDDAHTELSAIFGVNWLQENCTNNLFWLDRALYAEANVAFNYANFTLGTSNKFLATAKELVAEDQRVSEALLSKMDEQMDCYLTATSAETFDLSLV